MENTVIVVTKKGMGSADEKLQHLLSNNYLELLLQHEGPPDVLCFYPDGARLACKGSLVIEALRQLENKGVRLISYSTCLSGLELTAAVQVGIIGAMENVRQAQMKAEKVITL